MKSDIVAKHLLCGHTCKNCAHEAILTVYEAAYRTDDDDEYVYLHNGQPMIQYQMPGCSLNEDAPEGVCDKWESKKEEDPWQWI